MYFAKIRDKFLTLSLTLRLTLSSFFISLVTFIIVMCFVLHSSEKNLKQEYISQLNGYMTELSELLIQVSTMNSKDTNNSLIKQWIHSELTNEHYDAMLVSDNNAIYDSGNKFPLTYNYFTSTLDAQSKDFVWETINDIPFILARKTVYNDKNKFSGYVLVARNLKKEHIRVKELRQNAILICFLVSLIISFLTLIFSRATLSPINKLSKQMGMIGIKNLNIRLNKEKWPIEIQPVICAFDSMLHKLEENFYRLDRFSSDLAHELRTPIHHIKIGIDVLLSKKRTEAEYIEGLASSLENIDRLSKMIEDILFIARADTGKTALKKEKTDIVIPLNKITNFFSVLLEGKNITIDTSKAEGELNCDNEMILRCLINIVSNALRYVDDNGKIIIYTEKSKNNFVICVFNTGKYIDEKYKDILFERFFKPEVTNDYTGTGLGLSIVRSIMKLHDGEVTFENDIKNHGIIFKLIFPIDE